MRGGFFLHIPMTGLLKSLLCAHSSGIALIHYALLPLVLLFTLSLLLCWSEGLGLRPQVASVSWVRHARCSPLVCRHRTADKVFGGCSFSGFLSAIIIL